MEGIQSSFRNFSKEAKMAASSSLGSPSPLPPSSSFGSGALISGPPRQLVSIWTCSKVCAVCFVAGVFVGYTLKRRVRRWISRLLRTLKDD